MALGFLLSRAAWFGACVLGWRPSRRCPLVAVALFPSFASALRFASVSRLAVVRRSPGSGLWVVSVPAAGAPRSWPLVLVAPAASVLSFAGLSPLGGVSC
ncbi:MAG: hypothetical protein A2V88_05030 [Elusimicrobia bacterium RBG_16_66_12]|nr:MAG: hypothetical protein A2V88_05030 [Elusimicrobia bacterium RBG_16_66_12]